MTKQARRKSFQELDRIRVNSPLPLLFVLISLTITGTMHCFSPAVGLNLLLGQAPLHLINRSDSTPGQETDKHWEFTILLGATVLAASQCRADKVSRHLILERQVYRFDWLSQPACPPSELEVSYSFHLYAAHSSMASGVGVGWQWALCNRTGYRIVQRTWSYPHMIVACDDPAPQLLTDGPLQPTFCWIERSRTPLRCILLHGQIKVEDSNAVRA